jgi:hypothetical protein
LVENTCHLIEIEKDKCLLQHVANVETNVKYHSIQQATDQYTAENVSKIINQNVVVLGLAEDQALEEDLAMVEGQEMTEAPGMVEVQETDHDKCSRQPVVTVEMSVKCHSSQKRKDQFIATIVSKIINKINNS